MRFIVPTMLPIQKPKEPHLLREWVKYQLRLKSITLMSLALKHGSHRNKVSLAFIRPSPKWEKIIADAMLMMPEELWPERYAARAARRAKPRKRKSTRKTGRAQ